MTVLNRLALLLVATLVVTATVAALRAESRQPEATSVDSAAPTASDEPVPSPTTADVGEATPTPEPASSGTFVYAPSPRETFGEAPFRKFVVGAEAGLDIEPAEIASFVDSTLADPRSWIGDNSTGFERVDQPGSDVQFTLVVATGATVDDLCAPLDTQGIYSCGNNGWIALNLTRWSSATEDWPADLETYRRYLVNHEVGHYILGPDHDTCPTSGSPAPIMMQQSVDLDGCEPNGWVYPRSSG